MSRIVKLLKTIKQSIVDKGAAYVIIGSFLTKFVSFFGSVFLVRVLSKTEFGVLSYYENFIGYFIIFAGFGIATGIQRYLLLLDTNEEKKACYLNALLSETLWNIGLVACALIFFKFYPHPQAFEGYYYVAIILTLCLPFIDLMNANMSSFRAMFDYKDYAILTFFTSFLLVSMRIVGAVAGKLLGTVVFRLVGEILCAAFCCVYFYCKFFFRIDIKKNNKIFIKERNVYSLQIMFTNGLWAIFMLNDLFLLGQIAGSESMLADYKIAYVIPANLAIFTSAIGTFVAPYFTKKENERDWKWIEEHFKLLLFTNISIMFFITLLCFLLAKPIVILLYGQKYISCVPVMKLLIIASFFNNGVRATIANVLSAMGEQKKNMMVACVGIILQILLDVILIPIIGSIGVALSNSVVYILMSVILIAIFIKWTKQKTNGCSVM
ncbi:MAG: oligosaccharide flippase family protein [Bacillaceae bacterium]